MVEILKWVTGLFVRTFCWDGSSSASEYERDPALSTFLLVFRAVLAGAALGWGIGYIATGQFAACVTFAGRGAFAFGVMSLYTLLCLAVIAPDRNRHCVTGKTGTVAEE